MSAPVFQDFIVTWPPKCVQCDGTDPPPCIIDSDGDWGGPPTHCTNCRYACNDDECCGVWHHPEFDDIGALWKMKTGKELASW